jgi:hypothetical protein
MAAMGHKALTIKEALLNIAVISRENDI